MNGRLPTLLASPFSFNFANFSFPTASGGIFSSTGGESGFIPPPVVGDFLLLDGTNFLLLDGTNLTLL